MTFSPLRKSLTVVNIGLTLVGLGLTVSGILLLSEWGDHGDDIAKTGLKIAQV